MMALSVAKAWFKLELHHRTSRSSRCLLRCALAATLASLGIAMPATANATTATAISTGWGFSCALTSAGGVECWGTNGDGELGDGTKNLSATPVYVSGLTTGVTAISSGGFHSCALTKAGAVECWGAAIAGALGNGTGNPVCDMTTGVACSTTPVQVSGLTSGVTAISSSGNGNCALTTAGHVDCWGSVSTLGKEGENSPTPVEVAGLSGVVAISSGREQTCALINTGGAECWGYNSGDEAAPGGEATFSYKPAFVTGLPTSGVLAISPGWYDTCALTSAFGVQCWGSNGYEELGTESATNSAVPVDVSGLAIGVAAISAGREVNCALTIAGAVECWGFNQQGLLGDDTFQSSRTPVQVSGLSSGVVAISAEIEHVCALTSTGAVKCWGNDERGELGDGNAPFLGIGCLTCDVSTIPVNVVGLNGSVGETTTTTTTSTSPTTTSTTTTSTSSTVPATTTSTSATTSTKTTTTSTSPTTTTTTTTTTTVPVTSQTTTTTTSTTAPVKGLLLGNETTTYSIADAVNGGREEGFQFSAKATGKIEELEFRTASGANAGITGVYLGVFAESSGKPGEVLGQGKVSGEPGTNSWIKVSGLSISVTSGTKYWLVVLPLGESSKQLHYNEAVRSGGSGMAEDSVGGLTSMTAESSWTAYSQGPAGFQAIGTSKIILAPTNKSLPTTSATAEQGQTLTATTGSWENEPTGYTYQWERCNTLGVECTNISTPSSASYVPVEADVGHTIVVKVTASNTAGSASASSLASTTVKGASKGLLLGNETTTYSIADSVVGGREEGFQFTAKAAGKIEELEFRTAASANTGITGVYLGVFAESSGKPGEVLGQGKVSGEPGTNSWIKVSGLSISVTSGTKYWLVVLPLGESSKQLHYNEAVRSGGSSMAEDSVGGLTSMTAESSWTAYSQGPVGFQAIGP